MAAGARRRHPAAPRPVARVGERSRSGSGSGPRTGSGSGSSCGSSSGPGSRSGSGPRFEGAAVLRVGGGVERFAQRVGEVEQDVFRDVLARLCAGGRAICRTRTASGQTSTDRQTDRQIWAVFKENFLDVPQRRKAGGVESGEYGP